MSNNSQKTKLTAPKSATKAAAARAPAQRPATSKQTKANGMAAVSRSVPPARLRLAASDSQDQSRNPDFNWNQYEGRIPSGRPPPAPVEKKVAKVEDRTIFNRAVRIVAEPHKKKQVSGGSLAWLKDKIKDPAVWNSVVAAMQTRFPSKMGAMVPPIDVSDATRVYKTPRASQYKFTLPMVVSTESTPMYYGMAFISGTWLQKVALLNTLTASTNALASITSLDDPLYTAIGNAAARFNSGGMCVHFLNNTAMQTLGGEVIFGNIGADKLAAGISWDTLLAYQNTQYASMVANPDLCFPWMPGTNDCNNNNYNTANYTMSGTPLVPAGGSAANTLLFVACRSVSAQSLELCVDSVFGVVPQDNKVVLLGGHIWPQDATVFQRTMEKITPPDSVPSPSTPEEEDSTFVGVLKSLGGAVANTIVPGLGSIVEKGISWLGGLFGDHRLEDQLHMVVRGLPREVLQRASDEGTIPPDLFALLDKLYSYRILICDSGARYYRTDGSMYEYKRSERSVDSFGEPCFIGAQILDTREDSVDLSSGASSAPRRQ